MNLLFIIIGIPFATLIIVIAEGIHQSYRRKQEEIRLYEARAEEAQRKWEKNKAYERKRALEKTERTIRIMREKEKHLHEVAEKKRNRYEKAKRERLEKEKALPEHRRFIAEQRRLMTDSLRYDVLKRDNFRCQLCGASAKDGIKLHVDHIFPVSKGGKTEMSNLRTLCERCNMGKSDKIEEVHVDLPLNDYAPNETIKTYTPDEFARLVDSMSEKELIEKLSEANIEYVDKRRFGGCLWVASTPESDKILSSITLNGKKFTLAKSTANFDGSPGWYIKP